MEKFRRVLFLLIILIAFAVRIYKLADIPPGLNRDEAAIGYTAYSLLITGKDEYGKSWPLSLKSFGDWKLPLYVYASVPAVYAFDLTEFAVRFPSVIAGILTVGMTYFIALELFKNSGVAILAMGLLAISPWHIFFSRVASESNLAVFWVTLAFLLLLKTPRFKFFLPLGTVFFGLSLLTYHGNHIFTPLLVLILVFYFRKIFKTPLGIVSLIIFGLMAIGIFSLTLFSADKTKISGLLAIGDPSIVYENIVKNRLIYQNTILGKLLNNKVVFSLEQISQNYLESFSPEFLFIKGGTNKQHNIDDFGNLYLVEAPFLLLGLYFLFSKKEKSRWVLHGWLLIAPLAAVLTKDAPHSARQFAIFPALVLIVAYGIYYSWSSIQNIKLQKTLTLVLLLLFTGNVALFFSRYFVTFPYKSYAYWGKGYKEMITKVLAYKDSYKNVYISRPDYSPYIYYLFYSKADPHLVQTNLERYPDTAEGFAHVKSFDGITYKSNNWSEELLLPNQLYIDWAQGVPSGATQSAVLITKDETLKLMEKGFETDDIEIGDFVTSRLKNTVFLPDGKPLFYFIETAIGTSSAERL